MQSPKFTAGDTFPDLTWPTAGGGKISPAQGSGWRMMIVYRGKHCPLCKKYLATLQGMLGDFAEHGITVYTVSADPKEKAEADMADQGWTFPVGYGLTPAQMRQLGTYVSEPRSPQETDRPFSEPALFAINPTGQVQALDISNAPFARPDLTGLLDGLKFVMSNDYPIRGRA